MRNFLKSIFYDSKEMINLVKCTNCENQFEAENIFKEVCKFCGEFLFSTATHSPDIINYEIINYRNEDILKPIFKFLIYPIQIFYFLFYAFTTLFLLPPYLLITSGISKLFNVNKTNVSMDIFLILISYFVFTNLYSRKIVLSEFEIVTIVISLLPFLIFSSVLKEEDFNYDAEELFRYKARVYITWFFLALLVTYV